jgi:NADPH-dependent 2,4-dienoyl-CoA reductase/sulfur reductase-like enzyme
MKTNVIVVGGGPAGCITALTTKSVYPDKSVILIKEIGDGVIPCAIPYMLETLSDPEQNRMGDLPLEKAGIEVRVGKVVSFDAQARTATLHSGDILEYERLVLATGAEPICPPIPGIDLAGVFSIRKSLSAMTALREEVRKARKVVILGGGFIGTEFADEMARLPEIEVHLVELLPRLLTAAFDDELCDLATEELVRGGVVVHTGKRLEKINGGGKVESVTLTGGETIPTDLVLIGIGAEPESRLAEEAGLLTIDGGAIWVDSYMRTSVEGVFAVGDCAIKRDFFTRRAVPVMLASNATAEARIAGTNLYGIRVPRQIQGTIAAFSTQIGKIVFASAGMTNRTCLKEGFRVVTATAEAPDRHPGTLPGARPMSVQLIFADRSGTLLGGQISGGLSVGELINVVALSIQKRVTVRELDMMQIATHPLLTSAPTVHPFINAAHIALAKMRARARGA